MLNSSLILGQLTQRALLPATFARAEKLFNGLLAKRAKIAAENKGSYTPEYLAMQSESPGSFIGWAKDSHVQSLSAAVSEVVGSVLHRSFRQNSSNDRGDVWQYQLDIQDTAANADVLCFVSYVVGKARQEAKHPLVVLLGYYDEIKATEPFVNRYPDRSQNKSVVLNPNTLEICCTSRSASPRQEPTIMKAFWPKDADFTKVALDSMAQRAVYTPRVVRDIEMALA